MRAAGIPAAFLLESLFAAAGLHHCHDYGIVE